MNLRKYNWPVCLLALALTVLLLLGGEKAWYLLAKDKPLDHAFQGIEGVQTVSRTREDGIALLRVTLGRTDNFEETYEALWAAAEKILGQGQFRILLQDTRTPELEQFYYTVQYDAEEAVQTGQFSSMVRRIEEKSGQAGVRAAIYVDRQRIYLHFSRADQDMYVVVPRGDR
ncbi:hypothetical protein [Acetonema longum]|uniref:Uncharacterized protein n=1 Tax=Acetonema longum DSM 6540 TaxID=1009370 RepID=F7NEF7_9FIRM|nr:hypothetical protein [Acetonema longum]EGO65368.1 hypothetical protein ALO_02101 [Acetonema longum DSM 6540]